MCACICVRVCVWAFLDKVLRVDNSKEVKYEIQTRRQNKRIFQIEGTANAKALEWEWLGVMRNKNATMHKKHRRNTNNYKNIL